MVTTSLTTQLLLSLFLSPIPFWTVVFAQAPPFLVILAPPMGLEGELQPVQAFPMDPFG